jgi:hypothetical protein
MGPAAHPQHSELLTLREVLGDQACPGLQRRDQGTGDRFEQGQHAVTIPHLGGAVSRESGEAFAYARPPVPSSDAQRIHAQCVVRHDSRCGRDWRHLTRRCYGQIPAPGPPSAFAQTPQQHWMSVVQEFPGSPQLKPPPQWPGPPPPSQEGVTQKAVQQSTSVAHIAPMLEQRPESPPPLASIASTTPTPESLPAASSGESGAPLAPPLLPLAPLPMPLPLLPSGATVASVPLHPDELPSARE